MHYTCTLSVHWPCASKDVARGDGPRMSIERSSETAQEFRPSRGEPRRWQHPSIRVSYRRKSDLDPGGILPPLPRPDLPIPPAVALPLVR